MAHTHPCETCGEHYECLAPFERNDDGWPAVVCVARMEPDPSFHQCVDCREGRLPCGVCDGARRGRYDVERGDVICESCETTENEQAHGRMLEDYYGGSGPVTLDEQYQAAAKQKREQR